MRTDITYWRQKPGGQWQQIDVQARSVVAWNLQHVKAGEPWDDGYGNRYKWEPGS